MLAWHGQPDIVSSSSMSSAPDEVNPQADRSTLPSNASATRIVYALCAVEALAFAAMAFVLLAHESDPATAGIDQFGAFMMVGLGVAFIRPAYRRAERGKRLGPAFVLFLFLSSPSSALWQQWRDAARQHCPALLGGIARDLRLLGHVHQSRR